MKHTTMKPDPLENLMSKFDITGQTLALQRNGPMTEDLASSSAANDHEPEPEPHQSPRSARRRSLTRRAPTPDAPPPRHMLSTSSSAAASHSSGTQPRRPTSAGAGSGRSVR